MLDSERALGSFVGSAYGDSLGSPIEFMTSYEIYKKYGQAGITELDFAFGGLGLVTDDTQMAIATAEGLLASAGQMSNTKQIQANIWRAYQGWYDTQSGPLERRAPGNTCLSALSGQIPGTFDKVLNGSAGCGGVMRSYPIGFAVADRERAYDLGAMSGVLTHGHRNGYIPAGFLSGVISALVSGDSFETAVNDALTYTSNLPEDVGVETYEAIVDALSAPYSEGAIDRHLRRTGGWLGHDALAIALYSAFNEPDNPLKAVRLSVNHSGDSDSTGAITGAIVGAVHGVDQFERQLSQEAVELEKRPYIDWLSAALVELRTDNEA